MTSNERAIVDHLDLQSLSLPSMLSTDAVVVYHCSLRAGLDPAY